MRTCYDDEFVDTLEDIIMHRSSACHLWFYEHPFKYDFNVNSLPFFKREKQKQNSVTITAMRTMPIHICHNHNKYRRILKW